MKRHTNITIAVFLLFSAFSFPALAQDSSPKKHWYEITYKSGDTLNYISGSSSSPLEQLFDGDQVVLEDITSVASDRSARRATGVAKMLVRADTVISVREWAGDPVAIQPSTSKISQ
jgi:hypothetical protein